MAQSNLSRLFIKQKRQDCYQIMFFSGFSFSHIEKHWSNETATIRLINEVLVPYIKRVKEEKALPRDQKRLLIWDVFKVELQ